MYLDIRPPFTSLAIQSSITIKNSRVCLLMLLFEHKSRRFSRGIHLVILVPACNWDSLVKIKFQEINLNGKQENEYETILYTWENRNMAQAFH